MEVQREPPVEAGAVEQEEAPRQRAAGARPEAADQRLSWPLVHT